MSDTSNIQGASNAQLELAIINSRHHFNMLYTELHYRKEMEIYSYSYLKRKEPKGTPKVKNVRKSKASV